MNKQNNSNNKTKTNKLLKHWQYSNVTHNKTTRQWNSKATKKEHNQSKSILLLFGCCAILVFSCLLLLLSLLFLFIVMHITITMTMTTITITTTQWQSQHCYCCNCCVFSIVIVVIVIVVTVIVISVIVVLVWFSTTKQNQNTIQDLELGGRCF